MDETKCILELGYTKVLLPLEDGLAILDKLKNGKHIDYEKKVKPLEDIVLRLVTKYEYDSWLIKEMLDT